MASTALPPPPASAPGGGPPPASIMLAASAAAICRRRRQRNNNKCIIAFEAAGRRVLIDVPDRKGVEESRYTGELGGFFSPPDHPYPCPWRWRQARSGPARRLLAQQKGSKRRWWCSRSSAPPALQPPPPPCRIRGRVTRCARSPTRLEKSRSGQARALWSVWLAAAGGPRPQRLKGPLVQSPAAPSE
jgi:hypothetical protein